MAPTIQTGTVADRDRKQKPGDKKPDLVCRVKYCNTLPDIPFDPKFIKYPFLPNRFVEYKPTSLERSYKHDLLTEHDLGVTIDLINPDTYALEPSVKPVLGPEDERLLEEDTLTPQDSKRSRHHNKIVPWLKKTEYISNEFNRYGHSSEKTETKVGYNVKKLFKEENMYMERESQISAINKTFADVKLPIAGADEDLLMHVWQEIAYCVEICFATQSTHTHRTSIEKHYSKPGVTPVEVLPVFPDFQLWRFPFAQVMFDTDPAPPTQMEEMSQAMIRGVVDESGEQFVAYFLPTEETSKKRKREPEENADSDEEEFEYRMAREYNWNVKNKASKGYEENYFVAFRDKEVYYNELETRVRLSKRRAKPGMPPNNSVLVVKHRPYNEMEFNHQKARMSQLEPPIPEEEEEEEKAEEEEEKDEEEEGEKSQDEEKDENEASEAESDAEKDNEEREETKSDNEVESDAEEKADSDAEEKADSDAEEKADSDAEEKADSDAEEKAESEAEEKAESEAEEKAESENERSSAKSSSESEKGSSSESEAEEEEEDRQKKKRDEEEIFGSDSD